MKSEARILFIFVLWPQSTEVHRCFSPTLAHGLQLWQQHLSRVQPSSQASRRAWAQCSLPTAKPTLLLHLLSYEPPSKHLHCDKASPSAKQRFKSHIWFFSYFQKSGLKDDNCLVICCAVYMFKGTHSLSNNKNLTSVLRVENQTPYQDRETGSSTRNPEHLSQAFALTHSLNETFSFDILRSLLSRSGTFPKDEHSNNSPDIHLLLLSHALSHFIKHTKQNFAFLPPRPSPTPAWKKKKSHFFQRDSISNRSYNRVDF